MGPNGVTQTDARNRRSAGFNDEEHAEGKPVEDGAPHFTKDHGEALRPFLNS
jgi:hypothetical protein